MKILSSRGLLGFIVVAGLALRLHGLAFGLPALNDPDELMFELGSIRMLSGPTLNPGWFGHPGTVTIYLLSIVNASVFAVGWLAGWFANPAAFANAVYADPTWIILPGRVAMACFGAFCIYLTARLGEALFGRSAGLVAGALLAVDPLHVAWSQVVRTDTMATAFMLLCLIASVRIAREGRTRDTIMAALWLALAIATKWPFALTLVGIAGALSVRAFSPSSSPALEARRLTQIVLLSLVFLVLISPYLVLTPHAVLRDLQGEAQVRHLGATGSGFVGNAWWYLSHPVATGLGLVGVMLAAIGLWAARKDRLAILVILPVSTCLFVVFCAQNLVWDRWALPLMPLLSCVAGLALVRIGALLQSHLRAPAAIALSCCVVAITLLGPLRQTLSNAQERLHDTRQLASAWAISHIPAGSTVMVEHFAFDLLSQPWQFLFPMGEAGCQNARARLQGKIKYKQIGSARAGRSNVDYGTMPPEQRHTCKTDYAILTQYDRYAAESAAFPAEYAAYTDLIAKGEVVASFLPEKGAVGGPVIRIVRFKR